MSTERQHPLDAAGAADAPPAGGPEEPETGPGKDAPDPAEVPDAGEARAAALEAELDQVRAKLADTEAQLQRSQADFANYRRRMAAEQERWGDRAVARLARDLLPVADNLERALDALASSQDAASDAFREGVQLTLRQLLDTLAAYGIQPIDAVGRPFDPRIHEAVGRLETDAVPEDHVAAELQRGYTFKDEVLRPSMVQVAQRPARADAADPTDASDEEEIHGQGRGH